MRRKGTVLEAGEGWAVLLMPGGEFQRVEAKQRLYTGQIYSHRKMAAYQPLAAAAIIILALVFSINFFSVAAYARLSPGVELGVNNWGRIIGIRVEGDSGEEIIDGLVIWGKRVEDVLPIILERLVERTEDGQSADFILKIEKDGKFWHSSQVAIEHITQTLAVYSLENAKGRWVSDQDVQTWHWEEDEDISYDKLPGENRSPSSYHALDKNQDKQINKNKGEETASGKEQPQQQNNGNSNSNNNNDNNTNHDSNSNNNNSGNTDHNNKSSNTNNGNKGGNANNNSKDNNTDNSSSGKYNKNSSKQANDKINSQESNHNKKY